MRFQTARTTLAAGIFWRFDISSISAVTAILMAITHKFFQPDLKAVARKVGVTKKVIATTSLVANEVAAKNREAIRKTPRPKRKQKAKEDANSGDHRNYNDSFMGDNVVVNGQPSRNTIWARTPGVAWKQIEGFKSTNDKPIELQTGVAAKPSMADDARGTRQHR